MDPTRRIALVARVLFLITFAASIPALILYAPVLHHANYILGAGADTRVRLGAFLEILLAIADGLGLPRLLLLGASSRAAGGRRSWLDSESVAPCEPPALGASREAAEGGSGSVSIGL